MSPSEAAVPPAVSRDAARVVVLDPGFAHSHAHHLAANLGIVAAARQQGLRTVIVGGQDLDRPARQRCVEAGATVIAHWHTPGYPRDADRLALEEHERLARGFAEEIEALYTAGFLRAADHLHIHTAYSFHLEGLGRALWRLRDRIRGCVVISFMFAPGARSGAAGQPPEILDAREYSRHRRALAVIARLVELDITIATSCRAFQRVYATLWPRGEVRLHPSIVYRPSTLSDAPRSGGRARVLLFLGGPKSNKGLEFSAEVGVRAAPQLPGVEFVFHFNTDFPGSQHFAAAVGRLRRAGETHGNVTIIEGNLDDAAYDALVASLDTVCLFYDPAEYRNKSSGVLWDLLEQPRLRWLVSAQTWLADELDEIGIAHRTVTYGDAAAAVRELQAGLDAPAAAAPSEARQPARPYLRDLLRPYGDWLVEVVTATRATTDGTPATVVAAPDAGAQRILVVRTSYGHFSPLSGPSGFVPHLREMGLHVDEWAIPLGHDGLQGLIGRERDALLGGLHARLRSFQGNALPFETRLQRLWHDYDVVHFVDGEHAGLPTALARLARPRDRGPRLVATFHQPESVMAEIQPDGSYLRAFDRIHLLAPDQATYFERHVDASALRVVPHGIAEAVLSGRIPDESGASAAGHSRQDMVDAIAGRRVALCVGSWLRDHEVFLKVAARLAHRRDLVFVIAARGLAVDVGQAPNVLLFNRGLSDFALHALYDIATLLLLPLRDAAANNAILESMSHGLPIVTTDLPATRYYTREAAIYVPHEPARYAEAVERFLATRPGGGTHPQSQPLRTRARELGWARVAATMRETLYA